jgi:cardiolipin synthase
MWGMRLALLEAVAAAERRERERRRAGLVRFAIRSRNQPGLKLASHWCLHRWVFALGLLAMSGCVAPLPNAYGFLHSISLTTGSTPQIDSARLRPIPPAQRQILLKSMLPEEQLSPAMLHHLALMQASGGTPLVAGNHVTLLNNGPASYAAMLAAIAHARQTINLETFIFADDTVGRRFADLLIERSRHGVKVKVIYDSLGSIDTPEAFFDRMRNRGIEVKAFNPPRFITSGRWRALEHRDHRKLLIVDNDIAITGGVNISSVYTQGLSGRSRALANDTDIFWRDTDIEIRGPVVTQCQRLFAATWLKLAGRRLPAVPYFTTPPVQGHDLVQVIGSTPSAGLSPIYLNLLAAIHNAQRNVWITDAYFVPDGQFRSYLRAAARRGVDVELILPSETDHPIVLYASRSHYGAFLKSGVKIYERQDALLHSKTMTVDGVWSTVGSANLDWWSFKRDDEINIVVLNHRFAAEMENSFKADREQSQPIVLASWRRRSLLERGHELLGWLVERWL